MLTENSDAVYDLIKAAITQTERNSKYSLGRAITTAPLLLTLRNLAESYEKEFEATKPAPKAAAKKATDK